MIKPVHPFPARMAPELAFRALGTLKGNSVVLDPMTGSGTVLRQAVEFGHTALGFDVDPLAVLMSNVWSSHVNDQEARIELLGVIERVKKLSDAEAILAWQDTDPETTKFVDFWFAPKQRLALRKIAYVLDSEKSISKEVLNVFKLALSRIIVTKEQAASLARDTSHSRPHRISLTNNFDVMAGFERSAAQILNRLEGNAFTGTAVANLGDARSLKDVDGSSIDAIVTSPPYLNAIDYMRGHKLALVWLGYSISTLREIRTGSIGAEKALRGDRDHERHRQIMSAMGDLEKLPDRYVNMIERYAADIIAMLRESKRVLRTQGIATFVVGNSCLKGIYIKNSEAVRLAGENAGFAVSDQFEREIPNANRYLPIIGDKLDKRMRTETIISFISQ